MRRRDFAWYSAGLFFALATTVSSWAAGGEESYSGKWQSEDKSTELLVDHTGDDVHVKEQRAGKV